MGSTFPILAKPLSSRRYSGATELSYQSFGLRVIIVCLSIQLLENLALTILW